MRKCHLTVCLLASLLLSGCNRPSTESPAVLASLLARTDTDPSRGDPTRRDDWAQALRPRPLSFPRDHGAHEDFRIEWWYYTGNLQTTEGRRFGYQLTFFRTGLRKNPENPSRWTVRDLYTAHFAVSDIEAQQHYRAQRNGRAGIGQAGAETKRLQVWNGDWRVELEDGQHELVAGSDDVSIDLTMRPSKPLVLHGDAGLSQKGASPGNASYYYSFPRLATAGSITVDGTRFEVSGHSWMDHEFSTSFLEDGQLGWDWFSIQLEDNTELMLYQMRRSDGSIDPFSSGTWISPSGQAQHLSASDFSMLPGPRWHSTRTGGDYPLTWRIELPSQGLGLDVEPAFDQQEMVTDATTGISYWEGSISITGRRGQKAVQGKGYLELTGYVGKGLGSLFRD